MFRAFDPIDTIYLDAGQSVHSSNDHWYRVIQQLGIGGNAVTHLVLCTSGPHKGLLFALKIFRKLSQEERRLNFLRETAFLQTCSHPAIMTLIDQGTFAARERQYPFVIAEYLPKTLRTAMREGLTMMQKVSIALQMLSALAHLSNLNPQVVHRDIKPENMFMKGPSCVLGDFGLMKLLDGNDEIDREIFKQSTGPGMPFFYPTPDLVAYANQQSMITTKSDVFQLGLVLAELFTTKNPVRHPRDHYDDVVLAPLGWIPGELGGGVAALINRMLVMNPTQREAAEALVDPWRGAFDNAATRLNALEGRAF